MSQKTYEKDYDATMAALQAAIQKRDQMGAQMDAEIASLQERVNALETLIEADYPHKGKLVLDKNTTPVSAQVNFVRPQVTEGVRGLLMASPSPLTSGEIYEGLKKLGWDLAPESNPWALIHGICRRLVDQQYAREVTKGSRKAWTRAR